MTRKSSRSSGLLKYFLLVGGGGGITKILPGVYYLNLDINLIVHIGFSLLFRKIYIYI